MSSRAGRYTVASLPPWSTQATGGVVLDEEGDVVMRVSTTRRMRERCRLIATHIETGDTIDCGIDDGIPGVAKSRSRPSDDAEMFLTAEASALHRELGGVFKFEILRETAERNQRQSKRREQEAK